MNEEDTIIAELEADPIENNNPIEDLINSIQNKEYTDAEQAFNDIIGDRLQDTLDQAKMRIADQMYSAEQGPEEEDVEDLDLDFDDEEFDFDENDDDFDDDDDSYLNDIG